MYPGIIKYDMALNRPINDPTKLVILSSRMFTLGYINVKTATMSGVVGQYITPKEDVSNSKGLKSGFSWAFIGDQKARKTKGSTQYLQAASF